MSENKQEQKKVICPACFAKELDVIELHYDEADQEYYCTKCAYAGKKENIDKFIQIFKDEKYKNRFVEHPDAN